MLHGADVLLLDRAHALRKDVYLPIVSAGIFVILHTCILPVQHVADSFPVLRQDEFHVTQREEPAALQIRLPVGPIQHRQLGAFLPDEADDVVPVVALLHEIVDAIIARDADIPPELRRKEAPMNVGVEDIPIRHHLPVEPGVLPKAFLRIHGDRQLTQFPGVLVPDCDDDLRAIRDLVLVDAHGQVLLRVDTRLLQRPLSSLAHSISSLFVFASPPRIHSR